LAAILHGLPVAVAATAPGAWPSINWPRSFDTKTSRIEIYQPEIVKWDGDQLSARAAIAVGSKDGNPTYGVARLSARADVDKASGLVQLSHIKVDSVEVPTSPDKAGAVLDTLVSRLPPNGLTASLDVLQASYVLSQRGGRVPRVAVLNTPPTHFFRDYTDGSRLRGRRA
jgi:hypothetical protein